jgi:hypothetical protein
MLRCFGGGLCGKLSDFGGRVWVKFRASLVRQPLVFINPSSIDVCPHRKANQDRLGSLWVPLDEVTFGEEQF